MLLLVRAVYLVLIPAAVIVGIAVGAYVEAALLVVLTVLTVLRAPKERRDRLLGRRA